MKKQHILFILSAFNVGGAEIDVLNLAQSLVKRNIKVSIISRGGVLEKDLPESVKSIRLQTTTNNWLLILINMIRILFYCLFNQVTSINPQSIRGVIIGGPVAKILRIPLVATIHNIHHKGTLKRSVVVLNRLPSVVLFVSKYERQKFINAGLHPHISKVMYSGINLNHFPKMEFSNSGPKTMGIIARLSPEKGIDIGIRAFGKIADQFPETRLLIIGDGPIREDLEAMAGVQAADQIHFLGERHDIPELLKEIDFLLLPSFTESLSLVAREAMAAGKPVISSDVGGMKEIIKHGENGLLVPANNVSVLSKAIKELLTNSHKLAAYSKNARSLIEQRFSITLWVSKMITLYKKAEGQQTPVYTRKKNIIYMTTRFPFPKTKGDKLRAYHQIKALSEKHNVFLVTLVEHHSDQQFYKNLAPFCKAIIPVHLNQTVSKIRRFLAHFSWIPSQIGYFYSGELDRLLPKVIIANDIDTLFCQLIRGGQFAKNITNVWKIIDFVDAFSLNLRRNIAVESIIKKPVYYLRMLKTALYEQKMLSTFDKAIIISENDKKALKNNQIMVVPNGVSQNVARKPLDNPNEKSIIFTGNMDYWPNEDAVTFLMEKIVPKLADDIKIYLVGINNNPQVYKYASDRVIVTGRVPSIFDTIQQATIAVCPMRLGAGQQNKVLEAMAAGVPVVLTSVANSGINAKDCVLKADQAESFALAIEALFKDCQKRLELRERAYTFIQRQFDWSFLINQMEQELWTTETITSRQPKELQMNRDFTRLMENQKSQ
jgi:polysaccharide biosynthesis protein PslH